MDRYFPGRKVARWKPPGNYKLERLRERRIFRELELSPAPSRIVYAIPQIGAGWLRRLNNGNYLAEGRGLRSPLRWFGSGGAAAYECGQNDNRKVHRNPFLIVGRKRFEFH